MDILNFWTKPKTKLIWARLVQPNTDFWASLKPRTIV